MGQKIIQVLNDQTINKIAAGEVIDRPASVVKELLENALDAGSTRITITLEEGGKEFIRLADDGEGIAQEDIDFAWKRHATSKLKSAEDLFRVYTLGFRGEALASMAAVAQLEIETRHRDEELGTRVLISGGEQLQRETISRSPGTTITVRRLFVHSPVRRKFMGTTRAEIQKILAMVSSIAMSHPHVRLQLSQGDRVFLSLTEGSVKHRIGEILGPSVVNELVPVDWSDTHLHVHGFVSPPYHTRGRSSHQYLYVNGRGVQSPMMSRAWADSYDVLPPGRFPLGALFLTMPLEEVDVNVHPSKKEVRFLRESQVFWAIQKSVRSALQKMVDAPRLELDPKKEEPSAPMHEKVAPLFTFTPSAVSLRPPASGATQQDMQLPRSFSDSLLSQGGLSLGGEEAMATSRIPYLQLHNRYILFGVESGLTLVNQQAAHERVLYEQAMRELQRPGRIASQQLLFPEILELTPQESEFLESHLQRFKALAFDLDGFGRNTFQLRGIPMEIGPEKAIRVVQDMIHDMIQGSDRDDELAKRLARAYAKVACIRQGEGLDYTQMSSLMDKLFATQNPYVSPSGIPVVIRLTLDEINRRFHSK